MVTWPSAMSTTLFSLRTHSTVVPCNCALPWRFGIRPLYRRPPNDLLRATFRDFFSQKPACLCGFPGWRTLNGSQSRLIWSEDSLKTIARSRSYLFAGAIVSLAIAGALRSPAAAATPPDAPQAKRSPLLAVMQTELDRSSKTLSAQDPPAYYIGYTITDTQRADVSGSNGALLSSSENRNRWLEVSVRAGSYDLDNTHKIGERQTQSGGRGTAVPIDDDQEVLRRAIWLETDKQYKSAAEWLIKTTKGRGEEGDKGEGSAPGF